MSLRYGIVVLALPMTAGAFDPGTGCIHPYTCELYCMGARVTHMGDRLTGDNGRNVFLVPQWGGTVIAKDGDDLVCQVSQENEVSGPVVVWLGEGNDRVRLTSGQALVYGQGGNDRGSLGAGNDRVFCGSGSDTFDGGQGRDGAKDCEGATRFEYNLR